ncbi:DNL zinc finger-domain-containing protein [Morchella snyderi]|nr:DNL zinc finger-domain-containing protein [Morchella snyderi]
MNFARHLLRRAAIAPPPSRGISIVLPSLSAALVGALATPIPRIIIPRLQQSVRHESSTAIGAIGGAGETTAGEQVEEIKPSYQLTVTCRPCAHRSTHSISKQGYHHGSVMITCPGCRNRHVISDHLKIFGETARSFEDILSQSGSGETVKKVTLSQEELMTAAEKILKEKGIWSKDGGNVEVLPDEPKETEEDWRKGIVEEEKKE